MSGDPLAIDVRPERYWRRMTDSDLTVQILRGLRGDLQQSNRDDAARFEAMNGRFEVIETALRDLAERLVKESRVEAASEDGLARPEQRHAP